jgi:thiamine-monophosphate kinase
VKPEDRFVEKLRALLPKADAVSIGPGDDAAVIAREAGLLVATTDLLVEGVDFFPGEDPERLGRRAAAVNLSDLAAMGAEPEFFLLSIAFPSAKGDSFPLAVARGAIARAGAFGAQLVGGDLSSASQTVLSIALWGKPVGSLLRRSGAAVGDRLYLSGHPGEAAAGLLLARRLAAFADQGSAPTPRFPEISAGDQRRLLEAYHDPTPRIGLGLSLSRERLASAAIDISDGLGVDAGRLARASGVRLVLEADRLPASSALFSFAAMEDLDPLDLMIGGGDDYELLFAVRPQDEARLEEHAGAFGVPVTRIGRAERGGGAVLRDSRGERDVAELGHDHLESPR